MVLKHVFKIFRLRLAYAEGYITGRWGVHFVRLANYFGWLNSVDSDVVDLFLRYHKQSRGEETANYLAPDYIVFNIYYFALLRAKETEVIERISNRLARRYAIDDPRREQAHKALIGYRDAGGNVIDSLRAFVQRSTANYVPEEVIGYMWGKERGDAGEQYRFTEWWENVQRANDDWNRIN